MGIDVAWVDELLAPKQEVFDPKQCLTRLATTAWPSSGTVCLRFVDAFGDTTFNQAQIPVLLSELRASMEQQTDREVKDHLDKVIRLVERAVDRMHTYIKFTGD
jgi:hypothetical protein